MSTEYEQFDCASRPQSNHFHKPVFSTPVSVVLNNSEKINNLSYDEKTEKSIILKTNDGSTTYVSTFDVNTSAATGIDQNNQVTKVTAFTNANNTSLSNNSNTEKLSCEKRNLDKDDSCTAGPRESSIKKYKRGVDLAELQTFSTRISKQLNFCKKKVPRHEDQFETSNNITHRDFDDIIKESKLNPEELLPNIVQINEIDYSSLEKKLSNEISQLSFGLDKAITLLWENDKQDLRFFCISCPHIVSSQLKVSEISKICPTINMYGFNITDPHLDNYNLQFKLDIWGYDNLCQIENTINNLYNKSKHFEKVHEDINALSVGDYIIRNITETKIMVYPCKIQNVVSLNSVQTFMETKFVEHHNMKPRKINVVKECNPYSKARERISTHDGYYIADKGYSLNMTPKTHQICSKLCKEMHLTHIPILYLYLVKHSTKCTAAMDQFIMSQLADMMGIDDKKNIAACRQLRLYFNTLHNYYLKERNKKLFRNPKNEFLFYYESLLNNTTFIDEILKLLRNVVNN